jgi:hypothetical protein
MRVSRVHRPQQASSLVEIMLSSAVTDHTIDLNAGHKRGCLQQRGHHGDIVEMEVISLGLLSNTVLKNKPNGRYRIKENSCQAD